MFPVCASDQKAPFPQSDFQNVTKPGEMLLLDSHCCSDPNFWFVRVLDRDCMMSYVCANCMEKASIRDFGSVFSIVDTCSLSLF